MADYCRALWPAAGRESDEYNAMAIEFGDSPHSGVEVNELIADTLDCDYETPEVAYLDLGRGNRTMTKEPGTLLMTGFLVLIGETSNLVTHRTDLGKLQMIDDCLSLHLISIQEGWYIRAADSEEKLQ